MIVTRLFLCILCTVIAWSGFTASAPAKEMFDFPLVKLRSLDKITARTMTFEARVGTTLKFGPIFIKVQSCREPEPIEEPESAAFLQIWEVITNEETQEEKAEWIFSGWMFASSPGLSSMDHPIYDVWVLDCLNPEEVQEETEQQETPDDEGVVEEDQIPARPGEDL